MAEAFRQGRDWPADGGRGDLPFRGHAGEIEAAPATLEARLTDALETQRARWFLWLPVLAGLGITTYFAMPFEPPLAIAVGIGLGALVLRLAAGQGTLAVVFCGALAAVAAGFAMAKARTEFVRAPILERAMSNVEIRGFVELAEPKAKRGQRVTLRVTAIGTLDREALPVRVRIRTLHKDVHLKPGDAVRLKGSVAPPPAPAIPGGYDFGRAAFYSGIGGVGYAIARPEIDQTAGRPPSDLQFRATLEQLRQAMGKRIAEALPGESGAIATALITGERGGISEATNDAFRDSGLLHILSISGLHMVIMAGAVFFTVRTVCAAFPSLALRYPIKKWAAAIAALAAIGYMLLSGSSFATVRSTIMILIIFLAVMLDRPAIALRNVAIAALVILVLYPESVLDVGFQMSFAAVVALVSAYEAVRAHRWFRVERPRGWLSAGAFFMAGIVFSTLIASLAVAPFAAFHFHKSQQYAVLANLLAIPICNVLVMPAALATMLAMPLGLEALPLAAMGFGIDIMLWCARNVAALPGAVGRIPAMPQAAFSLMVLGGLWFILWNGRLRLFGLAVAIAGLALAPTKRLPDILVGRDGRLVAMRGDDGKLGVIDAPQSAFEIGRWLEHDGDDRAVKAAVTTATFRCDDISCVGARLGLAVAAPKHPAAFGDDCARSAILLFSVPAPRSCAGPGTIVDFFAVRAEGTHALYLDTGGKVRIATVEAERGSRPWTMSRLKPRLPIGATAPKAPPSDPSRIGTFAGPADIATANPRLRPEIADIEEETDQGAIEDETPDAGDQ